MKKQNGITLIALVITIIVLLILAGVSISLTLGQNGVLTQVKNATEENRKATAEEEIAMAWASCETDYWSAFANNPSVSKKDFFEGNKGIVNYLSEFGETSNFKYSENGTSTIDYKSKTSTKTEPDTFTISSGGKVTFKGNKKAENGVTARDIASATDKSDYYGKTVNYSANNVTDWKIFYSDENNIYLITSDYVENSKLPITLVGANTSADRPYSLYWNPAPESAQSPILSGKSWNTWTDYSSYNNGKVISTLLKTSNWDGFKNSYAEYAIGSPTLEMWVNSINAKYPSERQLATNKGTYGFYVYANPNEDGTGNYSSDTGIYMSLSDEVFESPSMQSGINHAVYGTKDGSEADSLYFPHTEQFSNCSCYWLASPTAAANNCLVSVTYSGRVNYNNHGSFGIGVRPIVCLQSGVSLTERTEGPDFDLNLE